MFWFPGVLSEADGKKCKSIMNAKKCNTIYFLTDGVSKAEHLNMKYSIFLHISSRKSSAIQQFRQLSRNNSPK